jgi:hypothetical protein
MSSHVLMLQSWSRKGGVGSDIVDSSLAGEVQVVSRGASWSLG